MLRAILLILLLAAGAVVALWQFDVIDLPFGQGALQSQPAPPDILQAVESGNVQEILAALEAGTPVDTRAADGSTALMLAVGQSSGSGTVNLLLEAGADVNARDFQGQTPLLLAAARSSAPDTLLLLLNAGADPTVVDGSGRSAAELAADNPAISGTILLERLQELSQQPWNPDWPSGYVVPVAGATISSRASHLPGALRAYRNGRHEGFDFYQGTVSVPIEYGTPIQAVAGGTVIRADTDYVEMTREEYDAVIAESLASSGTPSDNLDKLRGRQVWISHPGGFVSRYAHLSAIAPGIQVGVAVSQGQDIASTGNSGTLEAAMLTEDDPHPHVELWRGDSTYLGAGLEPEQIYQLAAQVFGQAAMPPYTE